MYNKEVPVVSKEKKSDEVTKAEQVAFQNLFSALVFSVPHLVVINVNNKREISNFIQGNFMESIGLVKTADGSFTFPTNGFTLENYDNWAFTPHLYLSKKELMDENSEPVKPGINCLAKAILTGTYFKSLNQNIQMAISIDHPEVLVHTDGEYFFLNLDKDGIVKEELPCTEEKKVGYQILRLKPEYKYEDIFTQKLYFVLDFDDAVLFEILENIEILRRMSLGIEVESLPGTYADGMKIAKDYAEVLQATDWGILQAKLFPEIVNIFYENEEEFANERKEVLAHRVITLANEIFKEALVIAQGETSLSNKDFKSAQEIILEKSKLNRKEIFLFLYLSRDFPEAINGDIVSFYTEIKRHILGQKFEKDTSKKIIAFLFLKIIKNLYSEEELEILFAKVQE